MNGKRPDLEIVDEVHVWDAVDAAVSTLAWLQAEKREGLARQAALTYLPRGLKWVVHRPRLLRGVYKLRPSWRPTIHVGVDGGEFTAFSVCGKDGLIYFEGSTARVEVDRV